MDGSILWRAALVQAAAVAVLSLALGLTLSHSFFESWGWLVGPLAWMGCAALTARVLGLRQGRTLAGAAVAGALSGAAVLAGLHWLGVIVAVGVFAAWCAWRPGGRAVAWS